MTLHMSRKINIKDTQGFTLIELLVVIAIIGVLSSVVLGSITTARTKALDAKRKLEFRNISTALYLYRDIYGTNPINRNPCCGYPDTSPNFLQELVTAGLLPTNPKSPTSPTNPYYYYDYGAGNSIGMLMVTMLQAAPPTSTGYPGTCRPWAPAQNWCDQSSNTHYCICNPY